MATAPSPNDLTRQQLDELDALLQKMLSVPMPVETPMPAAPLTTARGGPALADPPLPPLWRVDPPPPSDAGAFAPHLALVDPPSPVSLKPEPPAPPPAPVPPPPPPKIAPAPKAPAKPQAAAPVSAPQRAIPVPAPAPLAPAPAHTAPKAAPITPAPTAPPVPFLFLPFVALNALFDAACGLFGPPGRLLRSGFFKHLYGLGGLGLLLYTAAHVAQVQGWVTLPLPLPWPR